MKANLRARKQQPSNDEGVSPVIAVILMVAITVVLAATVYVWVSGFSSDESGPENAQVRASGFDSDNNGATDWIRLTLVRGENAPYAPAVMSATLVDHAGTVLAESTDTANTTHFLCVNIATASDQEYCTTDGSFMEASADRWNVGESFYVPCQGDGAHQITLTIRGSTVLDERINCDQVAQ